MGKVPVMKVSYVLATALACLSGPALAAEGWGFVNDPEELKFGYRLSGENNFDTIWFRCDTQTRQIVVSAAVGNKRPAKGRASVTLAAGPQKVTVSGPVSEDEFDGVYSLEVELPKEHALFRLLESGQPVSYSAPGWRRPKLSSRGQKTEVERFLAACR